MVRRPTLSLHGAGETIKLSSLGSGGDARFILLAGATGLGWAPTENTIDDLPFGGGVLRHRRQEVANVTVPIAVIGDYYERRDARRKMERVFSDEVEIRLTHPDGQQRSRFGWYVDGLDGLGESEEYQNVSTFVIAFDCPDTDWLDAERSQEIVLVPPPSKVFLTETRGGSTKPGELWASNYFLFPRFENLPVVEDVSDKVSNVPSNRQNRILFASDDFTSVQTNEMSPGGGRSLVLMAEGTRLEAMNRDIYLYPDAATTTSQYAVSLGVKMIRQYSDEIQIRVQLGRADNNSVPGAGFTVSSSKTLSPEEADEGQRIELRESSTKSGQPVVRIQIIMPSRSESQYQHFLIDEVLFTNAYDPDAREQDLAFWDGDTPNTDEFVYAWSGSPGMSVSTKSKPTVTTEADMAIPWTPIWLDSNTQSESIIVTNHGDMIAPCTITVGGPGENLLVENRTTGEVVDFRWSWDADDVVVIDSDEHTRDIRVGDDDTGIGWDYLTVESSPTLIRLAPGDNDLHIAFAGMNRDSRVTVSHRDRFRSGL